MIISPYNIASHKETKIGRFNVIQDEIIAEGKVFPYSYTSLRDCVCILPICNNHIVIINEYRHSLGKWMWEFPAGSIDDGEKPEEAAKRELLEETGYELFSLHKIGEYPVSPGTSSLMAHLYVAHCKNTGRQRLDETEMITVKEVTEYELEEMIRNRELVFLAGIVMWDMYKRERRLDS